MANMDAHFAQIDAAVASGDLMAHGEHDAKAVTAEPAPLRTLVKTLDTLSDSALANQGNTMQLHAQRDGLPD